MDHLNKSIELQINHIGFCYRSSLALPAANVQGSFPAQETEIKNAIPQMTRGQASRCSCIQCRALARMTYSQG